VHPPNELLRRSKLNPILSFHNMPYLCHAVFNPGAALVDGETLLLLRVEDMEGKSHLTVARSADGISGWRIEPTPLISPTDDAGPHEEYGCEDPRITYLSELGKWVIAYTAYSPMGAGPALALTSDFKVVERLGLVLAPNNKDAAVFPRTIKGRFWMLHRPVAGAVEHIWLTDSPDLVYWGHPWMVLSERGGPWWDGVKVGAATIPIETEEGWLVLYHGVKQFTAGFTYRVGMFLLDLEDPRRLIARFPYWILGPREHYETTGQSPNVVFPCGHVRLDDQIRVYYGAADTCVCMATASISELLEALKKYRI